MKYVDVHAHLNEEIFDKDRDQILKDCAKNEIFVVNCSGDIKGNRNSLKLLKYKNIRLCLGIYPIQASEMSDTDFFKEMKFIEENKKKIVGIGEVGLDYYWIKDDAARKKEIDRFSEIIWFANKSGLPLNVHSRSAEAETIAMLSKMAHVPVVVHAFGGDINLAKMGTANGFYFSIAPIILRSKKHQRMVEALPIQNLLTETDSPYLGPTQERNDPRNIPLVVEKIAEIKNMNAEDVRVQILKNTGNVFMLT